MVHKQSTPSVHSRTNEDASTRPCALCLWLTKRIVRLAKRIVRYNHLAYIHFLSAGVPANPSRACRVTLFIRKHSPLYIDGSPSARGVAVSSVKEAVCVLSHVCRLLEVLVCSCLFKVMHSSTRLELVAFLDFFMNIRSLVFIQKRVLCTSRQASVRQNLQHRDSVAARREMVPYTSFRRNRCTLFSGSSQCRQVGLHCVFETMWNIVAIPNRKTCRAKEQAVINTTRKERRHVKTLTKLRGTACPWKYSYPKPLRARTWFSAAASS